MPFSIIPWDGKIVLESRNSFDKYFQSVKSVEKYVTRAHTHTHTHTHTHGKRERERK
jgi:uncharacterized C2H2 Zn-finger protein